MALIKLEKVEKSFGYKDCRQQVLNGVSLEVNKGEMIAVMGPSGSGKSTLLNVLGLLDGDFEGKYTLEKEDVSGLPNKQMAEYRNKKIGFVFQNFNLIKEISALENIKMSLIFSNIYKSRKSRIKNIDITKRAENLLEIVGLKEHKNKLPNQLSGGQQQRVAITRALANDPDIILADEPTGALDSKTGMDIMKQLLKLNKSGKTIIIVTHDQRVAEMCGRVIYMKDGEIL